MKHYIATIAFSVDDDVDVKKVVDVASDRLVEYGGNISVYDTHYEEDNEFGEVETV